jgi:hypothetical protein
MELTIMIILNDEQIEKLKKEDIKIEYKNTEIILTYNNEKKRLKGVCIYTVE